jgi:hypothetical protein
MNSSRPIRVVFLSFYFEAWDALDGIYRQMLADPRFEPTVISIPRRLTGESSYSGEAQVSAFFDSVGIEHLRFEFEDSMIVIFDFHPGCRGGRRIRRHLARKLARASSRFDKN